VLDGRVVVSGPRQRNHPDFPLRGLTGCAFGGPPPTGSWSDGANDHDASTAGPPDRLAEVPPGKLSPPTRLEILLEPERRFLFVEFDHDESSPRPVLCASNLAWGFDVTPT